jgi:uncharacterized protein (TIGR02246 family)
MNKQFIFIGTILLFAVFAAVQTFGQESRKKPKSAESEIRAVLKMTAVGWNEGSLEKYLAAYTPEATEMLPATGPTGGVEAIEKTMKEGFWKNGKPLQALRYESVVVRMLGKENALVTGKFVLSGGDRPDRSGWFTSVWTKTKNGWRMIHDHS